MGPKIGSKLVDTNEKLTESYCWLIRVTIVVAFGFCLKIVGGGGNL